MARIFNPQNHLGQSLVTKQELTAEITKVTDLTEKLSLKIEVIEGELPTTVDSTYTVERLQSTIFLKKVRVGNEDSTDRYREYICANASTLTPGAKIEWEELGYIDNVTVPATISAHGTVKIVKDVSADPEDEATGPYVPTHAAVKTAIDAVKSDVNDVKSTVSGIEETIKSLATKTELDKAKEELNDTITSTKEELEGKITKAVGDAKSQIEKQIADLTEEGGAVKTAIDAAKSELSDKIDGLTDEDGAVTEAIEAAKKDLEEQISDITETLGDIDAETLKDVVNAIKELNSTVTSVLETEKVTVTAAYSGKIGGSNPGYIQFDIVQGETFIAAYIDSGSGDELCLPDVKYITTSGSATQMKVTMLNTTDTGVPEMTLKVITSKPYIKPED